MSRRASPLTLFRGLTTMERVDAVLGVVLTVLVVLQVALVPGVEHRFWVGVIYAPLCLGVAFRRHWPVLVGFGTQGLLSLTVDHYQGPFGAITVAWFCALYALAV